MERQHHLGQSDRSQGGERDESHGEQRAPRGCYEIPATMPCPEYGESVPASFVQFVD
jgi:hypothetical protein